MTCILIKFGRFFFRIETGGFSEIQAADFSVLVQGFLFGNTVSIFLYK